METNVGNADRALRLVAGALIIALGVYFKTWWGLMGIVPLFTGTVSWYPAYLPFGISTQRKASD